jgi:FAD/FMN-containing dehydrogenase
MDPVVQSDLVVSVLARIHETIRPDLVSQEASDLAEYGRDWTRVVAPAPSGIAFPRTTDEVSKLLAICNEAGVAVVPSGGRTGLAGGAVAARGEIVLSLSLMRPMGSRGPSTSRRRARARWAATSPPTPAA